MEIRIETPEDAAPCQQRLLFTRDEDISFVLFLATKDCKPYTNGLKTNEFLEKVDHSIVESETNDRADR